MAPPPEILNKFTLREIMKHLQEQGVKPEEIFELIDELWLGEDSRYYCTVQAKY